MGSLNIQRLLGVEIDESEMDLVVTHGGDLLSSQARVVTVLSPRQEAAFII